jgi:transcription elongation GreA/GreB family factor
MGRMNKAEIMQCIIAQLSHDLDVFFTAAKSAHEAATHAENIPDNKYDTLALEASYVAQGQANRAQEIRKSIEIYKQLKLEEANDNIIRLTSLVSLKDIEGAAKIVFIGPVEGGLKIEHRGKEIVVITPGSPMGRVLIGKAVGDSVEIKVGTDRREYEIVEVS